MRGTWQVQVYADPKGEVLAQLPFLVEDFEPERLDFSLKSTADVIDPADPPAINVDARFLYGAPAAKSVGGGHAAPRAGGRARGLAGLALRAGR